MPENQEHWSKKYLDDLNQKLKAQQNVQKDNLKKIPTQNSAEQNKQQTHPNKNSSENKNRFRRHEKTKKEQKLDPQKSGKKELTQKNVRVPPKVSKQPPPVSKKIFAGWVTSVEKEGIRVNTGHTEFLCTKRGPQILYVGDRVQISASTERRGVIEQIEPRQNWVIRPFEKNQKDEFILASNVNQIVIVVCAADPVLRTDWLDRLLIVCEKRGFKPMICCTKIDLAEDNAFIEQLDVYRKMGYRLIYVSSDVHSGVHDFKMMLKGKITIFLGPQGVGKTQLIQTLIQLDKKLILAEPPTNGSNNEPILPEEYQTTTKVEAVKLDGAATIIDTPGIREFELSGVPADDLKKYFREFRTIERCYSPHCLHTNESGCNVRKAAQFGEISEDRYQSYLKILESLSPVEV